MSLEQAVMELVAVGNKIVSELEKINHPALKVDTTYDSGAPQYIKLPTELSLSKKSEPKEEPLTEKEVRQAATDMIQCAVDQYGKEKGVGIGKGEALRVLSEFGVSKIEQLKNSDYKGAIRAFNRVAGTFIPDAMESDDLE